MTQEARGARGSTSSIGAVRAMARRAVVVAVRGGREPRHQAAPGSVTRTRVEADRTGRSRILRVPALLALAVLAAVWLAGCAIAFWLQVPDDVFFFHAPWLLHPQEQEHLIIAKQIAEHHSLTIRDAWFGQPGHGSEDGAFANGAVVPRTTLLIYFIYAVPFLISDTAWLWVTPFFGVVLAVGVGALVRRRTCSMAAGVLSAVAVMFTAPVMIASSGLVFENVVALAFLVWALVAFDAFTLERGARHGLTAGVLFAAAGLTRPDYVPAGLLAVALIALVVVAVEPIRERRSPISREALRIAWLALPVAASVAVILLVNRIFYGGSLNTGYGASVSAAGPVWSGSGEGILRSLRTFSPADFREMAHPFLFDIGRAQTILLAIGIAGLAATRGFRLSDGVLLGFAGFVMALHLGHAGAYGGVEPVLVHSPPRYLLPVYIAGIVLGFAALHRAARALPAHHAAVTAALIAGVVLIVAGRGLSEAYGTPFGFVEERRATERNRAVYEFAVQHPDDVFIGDVFTKALIGQRTIIPRLIPDVTELREFVRADRADGRRVFVVDTPKELSRFPQYSRYHELLVRSGFRFETVSVSPPIWEVLPVEGAVVPAVISLAVVRGQPVSFGVPVYVAPAQGERIDRVDMIVDGEVMMMTSTFPFDWSWDTRSVAVGSHNVSFRLVTGATQKLSTPFEVIVRNDESGDARDLVVEIDTPRRNETVSNVVAVRAAASAEAGIAGVLFYVDGTYVVSDEEAPFIFHWDSSNAAEGAHTLWVKAVDAKGHTSVQFTTVYVRNR